MDDLDAKSVVDFVMKVAGTASDDCLVGLVRALQNQLGFSAMPREMVLK
jgi:hypothetical protein